MILPIVWWDCFKITFACGCLAVIGFGLMSHLSRRIEMTSAINSLPLFKITCVALGQGSATYGTRASAGTPRHTHWHAPRWTMPHEFFLFIIIIFFKTDVWRRNPPIELDPQRSALSSRPLSHRLNQITHNHIKKNPAAYLIMWDGRASG